MLSKVQEIIAKKNHTAEEIIFLTNYEPNDDRNRLYSFYTPIWLCEKMYELAIHYGFDPKKGKILEPSCGNGNFLTVFDNPKNVTAFETDSINYQIAKIRSPKSNIYNDYFEKAFLMPPRHTSVIKSGLTWLKDYPFDLVIGNPPYGSRTNIYSSFFKNMKIKQIEAFFMYQSLRLLKPGGLLIFITSSSFLRDQNNTYKNEKKLMSEYAELVDAYRMPKVFKNTSVPTDIIVIKRK